MKIAHFSDLHINSGIRDSNINETIALFENALKHGAEHFFITGDLSHNAETEDFEMLRYILEYFNLLESKKVSIVIGNHDIFGGPQKAEDIFTFPQKCKEVDYDEKVKTFHSYFKEVFDGCVFKPSEGAYPYAKIINDILIIGLNSIDRYSSLRNPFASNGFIDEEQVASLKTIFAEFGDKAKQKIILVHHHFNKINSSTSNMMHYFWQVVEKQTMKLKKKKELLQLFRENGVDLVVHGHIHENLFYQRKGVHFSNSGGCFNDKKDGKLFYSLIESKKKGVKTESIGFLSPKHKNKYLMQITGIDDLIYQNSTK